ncbi:hypothetical protein OKA05_07400 [Luteolibacter arcticus]|uniref:ATP-binding protein n=1 Tax=Luteolibacter arcticus TaxID=1581411 RepID=A0ABT3GH72_9BACT|nr:hypothetical protein [Luteolibacter arcticus]MCW1922374.1 hypothetical protein [Luteolibacter arcticus]
MKAGENPFAPGRLERLLGFDPALAGTSWEALEEKWRALGCRAAVTGHRGAGKSALLRAWAKRCDSPVVLHFNEQRRRLNEADRRELAEGGGRLWFIDGEDYLHGRDRRELRHAANAAAGIVVTRYRAGSWPELIRLTATPATAAILLERVATSHADRFRADLEQRFRRCSGNLRDLWLECYDDLAGRKVL